MELLVDGGILGIRSRWNQKRSHKFYLPRKSYCPPTTKMPERHLPLLPLYEMASEQLHFNYASDRGMTVSWNTAVKLQFPIGRYGRGSRFDQIASQKVSVTYPTSSTYSNHVFIDGLKPDTEYSSAVHCADENDRHQFKTSLPAGDPRPYTSAFFGDLGTMGPMGLTDNEGRRSQPG